MAKYQSISINLPTPQWEWLQAMMYKHKLNDVSKAVRVCITCVAVGDAVVSDMDRHITQQSKEMKEESVQLSLEQLDYIQNYHNNLSEGIRHTINACKSTDEYTVFGVVRCKSSISKCGGAQDAVADIEKRFDLDREEVMRDVKENVDF
jgi:hypothetical protein